MRLAEIMGWRKFLQARRAAYQAIFAPSGSVGPMAEIVLADLRKFCRANTSTIMVSPVTRVVDPYASAVAEGRREVWNRIRSNLDLTDPQINALADLEFEQGMKDENQDT